MKYFIHKNIDILVILSFIITPIIIMWSAKFVNLIFIDNSSALFTNLSIEVIGSLLGSFVAVGLFVWQLNNEAKEKASIESNKEKEILDYVKYLANQGHDWISSQTKLIIEYCNKLNTEPLIIPRSEFDPDKTFDRLYQIFSSKDFHHIYNSKYGKNEISLNNYKNIEDCIDYFSSLFSQIEGSRKEVIQKYYNRIFRLQDMLNDEFDRLSRIMSKYEGSPVDNFSRMLFAQLKIIKQLNSSDFARNVYQFSTIRQHTLEHFGHISESQDIIYRIDRISNLKLEISENISEHKRDFETVLEIIVKMKDKYEKCTSNLRIDQ